MPYTHRSAANLVREGVERQRIYVTGNPIREVLLRFADEIDASEVLARLELEPARYFLATVHRGETVDDETRLRALTAALEQVQADHGMPIVCSLHPRTADRMRSYGLSAEHIRFMEPVGLFDFVALEREAFCVLSDSGTVQEECCIFGVPTVTLRDVTERPETVECGSNVLSGVETESVVRCVDLAVRRRGGWEPPAEYMADNVSETVGRIVLGVS